MTWQLTEDVAEFRRVADPYLAADPARNTVLLTVSESVRRDGAVGVAGTAASARFGWWRESEGAPVTGAFVQTPPRPPSLGPMDTRAARELARVLRASGPPVPGVRGEKESATAFAQELTGGADGRWDSQGMRLFRLGDLTPQLPAPAGRARLAGAGDVPLAVEWMDAFAADIGEPAGTDHTAATVRRIEDGRLLFWESAPGVPVSMAGRTPLVAGQIRVAPVYTPPRLRGRGYAAAVTAAVSGAAREAGADEVLLFTDTANPTTNALYPRLGYRPVAEYVSLDFLDFLGSLDFGGR